MSKEISFTGIIKTIRMGSKGNRKVIKIDDIVLEGYLKEMFVNKQLQQEGFDIEEYFRGQQVRIILI